MPFKSVSNAFVKAVFAIAFCLGSCFAQGKSEGDYSVLYIGNAVETLTYVCPKRFPNATQLWTEGLAKWKSTNQQNLNRLAAISLKLEAREGQRAIAATTKEKLDKHIQKVLLLKGAKTLLSETIINHLAESNDSQANELCSTWFMGMLEKTGTSDMVIAAEKLLQVDDE